MGQFTSPAGNIYNTRNNGDGTLTVSANCMHTKEPYEVKVRADALRQWLAGAHIQDCMSEVSKDNREFLISQISPKGWKQMFGGDED